MLGETYFRLFRLIMEIAIFVHMKHKDI